MSNRRFRKYPQTIVLRCPCCQEVKYTLVILTPLEKRNIVVNAATSVKSNSLN